MGFGIFVSPGDIKKLENSELDVTALCHDPQRLSALFYSDLDLNQRTLYAYYSPLTKSLLETLETTSVNVNITDVDAQWVTEITTDENLCSSFNVQLLTIENDGSKTIGKEVAGKQASVYLRQSVTKEVTNTTTGEKTTVSEVETIYESKQLNCTFGLMNPTYQMSRVKFCEEVADEELIDQIQLEREERENVTITQELRTELIANQESKEQIGILNVRFYSNDTQRVSLALRKSFIA